MGFIFINTHSCKNDRRYLQYYTGRRELDWQKRHQIGQKGHKQYKMKRGVWIFQTSTSKKQAKKTT